MIGLSEILNPPTGLSVSEILLISLILGMLHGATPDEHTWPITFSYAIGKYSTKGGMKAGFLFSAGFTAQRALLTTLGYIGLAAIYKEYNLDGPMYIIVGFVMAIAGSYILKGRYLHLPIDALMKHGSHEIPRDVPLRMTVVHGIIAGFGFGAYASIITFVLAPQLPSVIYSPLPGLMFGIGTMIMQIIFGAIFGSILRAKKASEEQITYVARKSAGRVLYYGGLVFMVVGALIIALPQIDNFAISTGISIPNLDAIDVGFLLVVITVGVIGLLSIITSFREAFKTTSKGEKGVMKRTV